MPKSLIKHIRSVIRDIGRVMLSFLPELLPVMSRTRYHLKSPIIFAVMQMFAGVYIKGKKYTAILSEMRENVSTEHLTVLLRR